MSESYRIHRPDPSTEQPLCCRYFLVAFEVVSVRLATGSDQMVHWAIGQLPDGQQEVLGAWPEFEFDVSTPHQVSEDLRARGVEKIRFMSSRTWTSLGPAYPSARLVPLLSESERIQRLPRRLRRAISKSGEAVQHLQRDANRAICRLGDFVDSSSAARFVIHALRQAERKIQLAGAGVAGTSGSRKSAEWSDVSPPGLCHRRQPGG